MKLGFVSAILPDLSLDEVLSFAASERFACVELMCWPVGKAERRYAGVTHVDASGLDEAGARKIKARCAQAGVSISGLGYYPNVLSPDRKEAAACLAHLKQVIRAARLLDVGVVNTFIGRDWTKSVDDNWPASGSRWCASPKASTCASALKIARCSSATTNGRAARTWPAARRSGGACLRRYRAAASG